MNETNERKSKAQQFEESEIIYLGKPF